MSCWKNPTDSIEEMALCSVMGALEVSGLTDVVLDRIDTLSGVDAEDIKAWYAAHRLGDDIADCRAGL